MGPGSSWGGGQVHRHSPLPPRPSLTTDTMDFSGLSLIKLKKQEMETQVSVSSRSGAELWAGGWHRP